MTSTELTRSIGTTRTMPARAPPDWLRNAACNAAAKSFASPLVAGSRAYDWPARTSMSNAWIRLTSEARMAGSPVTIRALRPASGSTRPALPANGVRVRARSSADAKRSGTTLLPAAASLPAMATPALADGTMRYSEPFCTTVAPFCASSASRVGRIWLRAIGVAVRRVAVPCTAGSMV